jgi:hypothetical protein
MLFHYEFNRMTANKGYGRQPGCRACHQRLDKGRQRVGRITVDAHGDDIGEQPYEQQELFP